MKNVSNKISAIVLTYNEQKYIRKCLKSIKWADEIIVADTGSIDKTVELSKNYTDQIYNFRFNNDFAKLRNKALKKANNEWILMLDADETLPLKSENKIRKLITDKKIKGYWFRRRIYVNESTYLKHGYFYPDYQLRLFRKENVRYIGSVHEQPNISKEKTKYIDEVEIYHDPNRSKYSTFFSICKMIPYVKIEAKEYTPRKNSSLSILSGMIEIARHTYRSFIKLNGYKDGYKGFRAALIYGVYKGLIVFYALLYRRKTLKSKKIEKIKENIIAW